MVLSSPQLALLLCWNWAELGALYIPPSRRCFCNTFCSLRSQKASKKYCVLINRRDCSPTIFNLEPLHDTNFIDTKTFSQKSFQKNFKHGTSTPTNKQREKPTKLAATIRQLQRLNHLNESLKLISGMLKQAPTHKCVWSDEQNPFPTSCQSSTAEQD